MYNQIVALLWAIQEAPTNIKAMYKARRQGSMYDVLWLWWNVEITQILFWYPTVGGKK